VCVYTDVFTHTHWTPDQWHYLCTYVYVYEREKDVYRQRCVCVDSDVCTHILWTSDQCRYMCTYIYVYERECFVCTDLCVCTFRCIYTLSPDLWSVALPMYIHMNESRRTYEWVMSHM